MSQITRRCKVIAERLRPEPAQNFFDIICQPDAPKLARVVEDEILLFLSP